MAPKSQNQISLGFRCGPKFSIIEQTWTWIQIILKSWGKLTVVVAVFVVGVVFVVLYVETVVYVVVLQFVVVIE
jgi:hypothetical protein